MATVKYVLKSDRTKSIDVESPFFSNAMTIDAKGVKSEMTREKLLELYEPVVSAQNLTGIESARREESATAQALARLEAKIDAIHKVVVPADEQHDKG